MDPQPPPPRCLSLFSCVLCFGLSLTNLESNFNSSEECSASALVTCVIQLLLICSVKAVGLKMGKCLDPCALSTGLTANQHRALRDPQDAK